MSNFTAVTLFLMFWYIFLQAPVGRIFFTGEHTSEKFSGYVHGGYLSGQNLTSQLLINQRCRVTITNMWSTYLLLHWAGIDTTKALLDEMRRERERKNENQSFRIEPLIALTGSIPLAQQEAVSNLHKFDIPRQLFLRTSNLGAPEAILWLEESSDNFVPSKYNSLTHDEKIERDSWNPLTTLKHKREKTSYGTVASTILEECVDGSAWQEMIVKLFLFRLIFSNSFLRNINLPKLLRQQYMFV